MADSSPPTNSPLHERQESTSSEHSARSSSDGDYGIDDRTEMFESWSRKRVRDRSNSKDDGNATKSGTITEDGILTNDGIITNNGKVTAFDSIVTNDGADNITPNEGLGMVNLQGSMITAPTPEIYQPTPPLNVKDTDSLTNQRDRFRKEYHEAKSQFMALNEARNTITDPSNIEQINKEWSVAANAVTDAENKYKTYIDGLPELVNMPLISRRLTRNEKFMYVKWVDELDRGDIDIHGPCTSEKRDLIVENEMLKAELYQVQQQLFEEKRKGNASGLGTEV